MGGDGSSDMVLLEPALGIVQSLVDFTQLPFRVVVDAEVSWCNVRERFLAQALHAGMPAFQT